MNIIIKRSLRDNNNWIDFYYESYMLWRIVIDQLNNLYNLTILLNLNFKNKVTNMRLNELTESRKMFKQFKDKDVRPPRSYSDFSKSPR